MKRGFYYIRIAFFLLYLLALFLLIDNIYIINFYNILFVLSTVVYVVITITSILSKKIILKDSISLNILNIGLYMYVLIIYQVVSENNILNIMNNLTYFRNNYLIVCILYLGIIIYTLIINKEEQS